ncbi:MAG TPA: hypothetical protein VFF67_04260 [Thermoplasmata archaeon]|nr:hypothetical protein [Thermoplasmata archaeon]
MPLADDPVRATLLAILRLLNQADADHEGDAAEQALELAELERRLENFIATQKDAVNVSLAVGLLLRNGFVAVQNGGDYSWTRQRDAQVRYGITAEGKKFLVEAMETSDRIPGSRPANGGGAP